MVQGRMGCIIQGTDDIRGTLGFMARAAGEGSLYRWRCVSCPQLAALDLDEWLERCGPRYSMLNQIDVCPACGSPRSLLWGRGSSTPYLPMKVEWLWMTKEVSADPEAWYEIRFVE